jgi:hypothetical protein
MAETNKGRYAALGPRYNLADHYRDLIASMGFANGPTPEPAA